MLRRNFITASQLVNRRFASTSSAASKASAVASKATSTLNGISSKATGALNFSIYWGKVAGELAKYIYEKEVRGPPSLEHLKTAYQTIFSTSKTLFSKYLKAPAELISDTVSAYTSGDLTRYGAYTVQLFGLFSLGEIIGRRHIYGYPSYH